MGVGTHRNTKCPPETKISNFDGPLSVDEKVLGLQVTVDHSAHVHEDNSLQDLVGVALKGRDGGNSRCMVSMWRVTQNWRVQEMPLNHT